MVDLRRHQRTPIDLAVEFLVQGSDRRYPAVAKDVSIGGMFVETPVPLPFATQLAILLPHPSGKPLVLPAVVRWTQAAGMGVQFGLLGARETHALTELAG